MRPWSTEQLSTTLNVTPQRISQLIKSGVLPRPTQGKHDPFKAVSAYISFISQRLAGGDLKAARIAKYAVETALRELEYKQKSGELILKSVVEKFLFANARIVRDGLQNIPPRVAGLCAAERSQDRIFALLTKEIDDCLEGLCNENLQTKEL